jgi:hypothetical protein
MQKKSFYNSSGYNTQSTNTRPGKFSAESDDNLYINDSMLEDEDDYGDEWDDMQDSVTFDKQAVKINNAIKKNGDRIK